MPGVFTDTAYQKHLMKQLTATRAGLVIAFDRQAEKYSRLWAHQAAEKPIVFYYTRKRDAHAERRELLHQLARL